MTPQDRRTWVMLVVASMLIAIVVGAIGIRWLHAPVTAGGPSVVDNSSVEPAPPRTGPASDAATPANSEHDVSPALEPVPAIASEPPAAPAPVVAEPAPTPSHAASPERRATPPAPEPSIPLPVARVALSYVGADPDAELVWAYAINDPAMSAHARSDLIEDLNETGFPDPKNVTEEDLPLIVNRLALIEQFGPDAMDQTNADAFAEAYKDLVNMYLKVTAN
jgi:hypothetical protein